MPMLGLAVLVLAAGGEVDFYLTFDSCKTLATKIDDSTGIVAADIGGTSTWACARRGRKVKCTVHVEEEVKTAELDLVMDIPPMLAINRNGGADDIMIDATKHIVVSTTRMLGTGEPMTYASKVCKGLYMTRFEYDELSKRGR